MKNISKSLTLNSIFYLFYNLINIIFPFITGIYVTHILLPDTIGMVEIARNVTQYFYVLSFLGIPTYGLREIAKYKNDKEKINKVYSELMVINFISTIFFYTLYILVIILIPQYNKEIKLFLVVGLSIFLNIFNNSWLYEGLEEFKYISIRNFLFKIFSFGMLIIFVKSSDDYLKYAAITVIGTAGNYLFNIIHSKKFVKFTLKNLNLKQHMKSIFLLVVVNLAIEIYSLIDITMLGNICLKENVAFYSYGIKIYKILLNIVNTFTIVLVPKISSYYSEGKIKEYNEVLSKTLKTILLVAIPMIVGILFTSNYLICKMYGSSYIRSSYVLKIVSMILLISPVGYLLGSRVCLVTGNEKKMVIPVVCGAVTNVILNSLLIPKFFEFGAAIASVIGELVVMIIYISLGKKFFELVNIKNTILKESFAIVLMIIYLMGVKYLFVSEFIITILQIIGSILIYFGTLLLLKEEIVYNFAKKIFSRRYFFNNKKEKKMYE